MPLQRHDDTTILSPEAVQAMEREMWDVPFYVGETERFAFEKLLELDGDFVVRKIHTYSKTSAAVAVRHGSFVEHVRFGYKDKKWNLRRARNSSLKGLIETMVTTKMPILEDGPILVRPYLRPSNFILHEQIAFEDNKEDKIGAGQFGKIFKGHFKNASGQYKVAIKRLKVGCDAQELLKEAGIMAPLVHKNIVRSYGIAALQTPVLLVVELARSSLVYHLKQTRAFPLSHHALLRYAKDVACGLIYLSKMRIIHRDIAARNCLISDGDIVKVSDFGLSVAGVNKITESTLKNVPIRWLAPETLRKDPDARPDFAQIYATLSY